MFNKYLKVLAIAILVIASADFAWYTKTNSQVERDYEVTTGTRVSSGVKLSGSAGSRRNNQRYFIPKIQFTDKTGRIHVVEGYPQSSIFSYKALFAYFEPKQGDSFPLYYDAKEPDEDYLYNEGEFGLYTWHLPLYLAINFLPVALIFAVIIEIYRRKNKVNNT